LVDQLAAGGVDQTDAVFHLRERLLAERAAGLVCQRQVQAQEVGRAIDILRLLDALGAELAEALLGDERVVGDDAHPQPERPPRHLLADPAEAKHTQRLAVELDAAIARALPASLLQRRVGLRNVARECEQQADRVLGGGDDGRFRRVRDDDAPAGGGLDVDVVDAHSGPADHLQAVGALAQELHARVGDRLRDQNALHTRARSSYASSALVTATPRSISAPRSASTSSTAASAVVMSKTSKKPMWPIRKIFPFSEAWPFAIVIPNRSRSPRTSSVASIPSGARIAVTTAERSSSGEKSSSPIALAPSRQARPSLTCRSKTASRPCSSRIPRATSSPATSETGGVNGASRVA